MENLIPDPSTGMIYASFWERAGAFVIDAIVIWVAISLLGNLVNRESDDVFIGVMYSIKGIAWQILVAGLYFFLQESSVHQATLGKRALSIKVGDMEGGRIGMLRSMARYLSKIVSSILLFSGFLMMFWSKKGQTLHDKWAGTVVFK